MGSGAKGDIRMPKPADTGPKPSKLPLDKMPLERLQEVQPEGSGLSTVVNPPTPPASTALTTARDAIHGNEPWLFDDDEMALLADLNPGAGDSYLSDVEYLNGKLYLSYTIPGPDLSSTVSYLGMWDSVTRSVSPIMSQGATQSGNSEVLGTKVYWSAYGSSTLTTYETTTGQSSSIPLPSGYTVYNITSADSVLFVNALSATQFQTFLFDPATGLWSNPLPAGYLPAGGGSGVSFGDHFLMNVNLNNTTVVVNYDVTTRSIDQTFSVSMYGGSYDGVDSGVTFYMGGDVYALAGGSVIKGDAATGVASIIDLNESGGLIAASDTAVYGYEYAPNVMGGDIFKITEAADGSTLVSRYDVNMYLDFGRVFNGSLYLYAANWDGSAEGIYRLDESTGSLVFVRDFGVSGGLNFDAYPLAEVNGALVVWADADGNGTHELWSSKTPEIVSSWVQISPTDVDVTWYSLWDLPGDLLFI